MFKKSIISLNSNENSMVDVAQLVESRIVAPVVAGSSPVIHPYYRLRGCGGIGRRARLRI